MVNYMHFNLNALLHSREGSGYDLLEARSPITSEEILSIEYGAWPPKGLDFRSTQRLKQPVVIASSHNDEGIPKLLKPLMYMTAGYVRAVRAVSVGSKIDKDFQREVYINTRLFGNIGQILTQTGCCGAWMLCQDQFRSLASPSPASIAASVAMLGMAWSSQRYSYLQVLLSPLKVRYFPAYRSITDTIGHEHLHVLQTKDRKSFPNESITKAWLKETSLVREMHDHIPPNLKKIRTLDKIFSLGQNEYYSKDDELQARLHTTLVRGYKRWGKLPESRQELWAALIDSGIRAPTDIKEDVKAAATNNCEVRRFLSKSAFFRFASGIVCDSAAEINIANSHHSKLGFQDYLWKNTFPYLYGHLLELYGDRQGRKKMGFGKNTRPRAAARNYFAPNAAPLPC